MSRVFVLGAGASMAFSDAALLNDQLLPKALEHRDDDKVSRIARFIEHTYPVAQSLVLNRDERLPQIEDVLSLLDLAIMEDRPLSQSYRITELRELRRNLVYAICLALKEIHDNNRDLSRKFTSKLTANDSVICLNYDLIIDNAVLRGEFDLDYHIPLRNSLNFARSQQLRDIRNQDSRSVFKLHGSLNWLYCPRCQAIDVTPREKGALYIYEREHPASHCSTCGVRYRPVIITPTFLKSYGNSFLAQIWREAETDLTNADEIIFVGYSLPDADVILRTMFIRALFENRMRREKKNVREPYQVRVIDLADGSDTQTHMRYARLFGDIDYDRTGFAEYIDRGCKTVNQ